jgi:lipopolysaccharide exporter
MTAFVGLNRLARSRILQDAAVLSLGNVFAQVLSIAAMLALARFYPPSDFGRLAVFMAVSSLVGVAVTLRYEAHLLLPAHEDEADSLLKLCLACSLSIGLLLVISAAFVPRNVTDLLGLSLLGGWLPVAILGGVAAALIAVGSTWLTRHRAFSRIAVLRVSQVAIASSFSVLLGVLGSPSGLLLGQIVGLLATTLLVYASLPNLNSTCRVKVLKKVATKHIAAPRFLLPMAVLDSLSMQLPILLISTWSGVELAGQFSVAWRIAIAPVALVGAAMGQVFFQRFSATWPDRTAARRLLFDTWSLLLAVGVVPALIIGFGGGEIFAAALGEQWTMAGSIAGLLAPMLLAMFVFSSTSSNGIVVGEHAFCLKVDVLLVICRLLCFFCLLPWSLQLCLVVWSIVEVSFIVARNLWILTRMAIKEPSVGT